MRKWLCNLPDLTPFCRNKFTELIYYLLNTVKHIYIYQMWLSSDEKKEEKTSITEKVLVVREWCWLRITTLTVMMIIEHICTFTFAYVKLCDPCKLLVGIPIKMATNHSNDATRVNKFNASCLIRNEPLWTMIMTWSALFFPDPIVCLFVCLLELEW